MTRLVPLTYREVIQRLRAAGFEFDRQAKGSHEIWYNPQSRRRTTVPHPARELCRQEPCGPSFAKPDSAWTSFYRSANSDAGRGDLAPTSLRRHLFFLKIQPFVVGVDDHRIAFLELTA